jgi:hypothetical protein
MSIITVETISAANEDDFKRKVNAFLDKNEELVFHDKTVYGVTQESRIDDEYGMLQGTLYSAIFQLEGSVRRVK